MFIINDVNLKNRPKRLLRAQPSKFQRVYGRENQRQAWSYFTYVPKEERFSKLTKFASADRFEKPSKDLDLPFKKSMAVSKPSDFEVEEPRGVRFGAERKSYNFGVCLPAPTASSSKFRQHDEYKPEGCLLGKKEVRQMTASQRLRQRELFVATSRLKDDVENFNNMFSKFEKPQEVGIEIIEAIQEMQMYKKDALKKVWGGSVTDFERAHWAEMLVPESI